MGFLLRVASEADRTEIAALIEASVRGLQAGDYTAAQIEGALTTVFTIDSQLIVDGTYLVAVAEDGSLAGCGGWSYRKTLYGGDHHKRRTAPETLNPAVDAAKIRAIFVHPAYARQGVGSALLRAAEEAAAAAGFRRFEMGSTLTGVSLYVRKGYRETSRVSAPVGGGEQIEVVLMSKATDRVS